MHGLAEASVIGAGPFAVCAATGASGTSGVYCWGRNESGQLGDGTLVDRYEPVRVVGIGGASSIGGGWSHTCAVVGAGAMCWGSNGSGEVGDGTRAPHLTPVSVVGLADVTQVGGGVQHACALTGVGSVYCWGSNAFGKLGDSSFTDVDSVKLMQVVDRIDSAGAKTYLASVGQIASGSNFNCARVAGDVACWGADDYGQLGDGNPSGRGGPGPFHIGLSPTWRPAATSRARSSRAAV